MNTAHELARLYIDTWNETDPKARRAKIAALYTERCLYTDPHIVAAGPQAIDDLIGLVQKGYPGLTFSLASDVDAHHDLVRFGWQASMPGAREPAVIGFDVVVTDAGRIQRVLGFLDKDPAASSAAGAQGAARAQ